LQLRVRVTPHSDYEFVISRCGCEIAQSLGGPAPFKRSQNGARGERHGDLLIKHARRLAILPRGRKQPESFHIERV